MRLRATILAAVLLLAVAGLAGAAAPAAAPLPEFCAAAPTSAPHLAMPVAPLPPFFAATLCGTCSDTHCLGHNLGSACAADGILGHCYINDNCPGTNTWQCQCLPGSD